MCPRAPLNVDGDTVRLTQVLGNLLNNGKRLTNRILPPA